MKNNINDKNATLCRIFSIPIFSLHKNFLVVYNKIVNLKQKEQNIYESNRNCKKNR